MKKLLVKGKPHIWWSSKKKRWDWTLSYNNERDNAAAKFIIKQATY